MCAAMYLLLSLPLAASRAGSRRVEPVSPVLEVFDLQVDRDSRRSCRASRLPLLRGERVALMGPSGAGKTTVLRAIGASSRAWAARSASSGRIPAWLAPRRCRVMSPTARIGMVFQFHHLFEHLTALQNVRLALFTCRGATGGGGSAGTSVSRSPWGGTSP